MKKWTLKCRDGLYLLLENESLFLLAAFLLRGTLFIDPLKWHLDELTRLYTYVLCPWGGVLIGLRLARVQTMKIPLHKEMPILFLLFAWIVFPMLFRFGTTFNNAVTNIGYAIVFFGLYASIRERPRNVRRKRMIEMGVLFTALSIIWGGLLLYCALTGTVYGRETGGTPFGVQDGLLFGGVHYNSVGMMAIGCLFMSVCLIECTKNMVARVAAVIAVTVMILVIILSQSRSTRYAMLLAFAFGLFLRIMYIPFKNKMTQKGVAVTLVVLVLIGGYLISSMIMNIALAHYEKLSQSRTVASVINSDMQTEKADSFDCSSDENSYSELSSKMILSALAEETMTGTARVAVDATFSDRTNIWRNLFDLWRSDLKKMFIGRGVGNTGSLIAHDTTHEVDGTASVHNTFLQFAADFGLIGLALQLVFFFSIFFDAWRGVTAGAKQLSPGNLSMGMMVLAIFAIGMMESAPLGQMTPANLMLYTALGFLTAEGNENLVNQRRNAYN